MGYQLTIEVLIIGPLVVCSAMLLTAWVAGFAKRLSENHRRGRGSIFPGGGVPEP